MNDLEDHVVDVSRPALEDMRRHPAVHVHGVRPQDLHIDVAVVQVLGVALGGSDEVFVAHSIAEWTGRNLGAGPESRTVVPLYIAFLLMRRLMAP
jgi:hypothetical protein